MLWTRALYLNGEWDALVECRIPYEQERLYPYRTEHSYNTAAQEDLPAAIRRAIASAVPYAVGVVQFVVERLRRNGRCTAKRLYNIAQMQFVNAAALLDRLGITCVGNEEWEAATQLLAEPGKLRLDVPWRRSHAEKGTPHGKRTLSL